jgi:hypothetical protein
MSETELNSIASSTNHAPDAAILYNFLECMMSTNIFAKDQSGTPHKETNCLFALPEL